MIDPYVEVKLTHKQLHFLVLAAEDKIKAFNHAIAGIEKETGREWEGGDIDEWDANGIAVLQITIEELKSTWEPGRNKA